ncbi:MAG: alpha-ketoacid dehydrogenase subunit beta [Nitrospirales bacterium]|nr:alpha-ketoacid dehydrogenase subunit beta [Nitrospirales bacterium]
MNRQLTYIEAIREALTLCLDQDPCVYVMGLGVPDPKGIFGSTRGLQERYGEHRIMDMPTSENGMTGVALGSALMGMKPVLTHQRMDFALLAMEQMVNQAANWRYMFGGQHRVPLVIRLMIGRGWGQGPQHSQSLQAWFAHVPGLKVVMPTTAYDAKGLLIASIEDPNPVIFLEHRWLHETVDDVPAGHYTVPLGKSRILRHGNDVTIVGTSYMALESVRAADRLAEDGINADVIDLRSLRPMNDSLILASVRRTGRLLVTDTGWTSFGVTAEIISRVVEGAFSALKCPPKRIALPDCPTPTSHALAEHYYPRATHIMNAVRLLMEKEAIPDMPLSHSSLPCDVPDLSFAGPF